MERKTGASIYIIGPASGNNNIEKTSCPGMLMSNEQLNELRRCSDEVYSICADSTHSDLTP